MTKVVCIISLVKNMFLVEAVVPGTIKYEVPAAYVVNFSEQLGENYAEVIVKKEYCTVIK